MPNLFFLKPAKTDSAFIHSNMSVNHAFEAEGLEMQKNERSITVTFLDAFEMEAFTYDVGNIVNIIKFNSF